MSSAQTSQDEPGEPTRQKPSTASHAEMPERELTGSGHSSLSRSQALRARDLNRPELHDLAEAERDVVIVRRNWQPPANGSPPTTN